MKVVILELNIELEQCRNDSFIYFERLIGLGIPIFIIQHLLWTKTIFANFPKYFL